MSQEIKDISLNFASYVIFALLLHRLLAVHVNCACCIVQYTKAQLSASAVDKEKYSRILVRYCDCKNKPGSRKFTGYTSQQNVYLSHLAGVTGKLNSNVSTTIKRTPRERENCIRIAFQSFIIVDIITCEFAARSFAFVCKYTYTDFYFTSFSTVLYRCGMYRLSLLAFSLQVCWGFTGRGLFYPGRTDLFELSLIHLNDFHAR